MNSFLVRRYSKFLTAFIVLGGLVMNTTAAPIVLLAEKVPCAVPDKQESQVVDRVHLDGWIGSRLTVNESNRLAKLDTDRLLEGYRHRPGRQTWDGEHVGKWLHAATLAWANSGDPVLRKKLDLVASELVKCQLPDGYLGTYLQTNRWKEWDVWAHKYNLIGLVTYMRYTGNQEPMQACRRMADLLCNTFGDTPGKKDIIPAGFHMGLAPTSVLEPMVLLYRLTGEQRYLDFCKYILRSWEQPNGPKVVSTLLAGKSVEEVGDAKAYEMLSCLNGALEYHRTVGDAKILKACLNAWKDIVENRLYITGTSSYREHFHANYDFPNVNNVGETCVTVTWLQFNAQLLRLTGEKRFADQLERTIVNQLMGAQSCDGGAWGYYVQMEGKKPYSSNLDGHCCLSSGPRGVALIPTFAITTDADGAVINLYDSGHASLTLRNGDNMGLKIETQYPSSDAIHVTVSSTSKGAHAIKLRVPDWCYQTVLTVNGKKAIATKSRDGYIAIKRTWTTGDAIDLQLKMEPRIVIGDHKNDGKLAILYGPLVLALDADASNLSSNALQDFRIAETNPNKLRVVPEPAPEKFKTWSGARSFRLVTDAGELPVRLVPFADAGSTGAEYEVWLPYGAPRAGRNLLLTGFEARSRRQSMGDSIIDNNFQTYASTSIGKHATQDWFTVILPKPVTISRVVVAHGHTEHNGGWFDASAGKPRLQIKVVGEDKWKNLCEIKDYPNTTATNPAGLTAGERFTCKLEKPVEIAGIRVIGKPASGDDPKQAFATCAELQAYNDVQ
jgi:DUF1680 family protein